MVSTPLAESNRYPTKVVGLNNFAISSGGIGEALQRSASSLKTANATLDESIALITAGNTVVQNPESVGGFADNKNGYIG